MRDVLQVATRSGSGSAARALGGGLAGIALRPRRILVAAAVLLLVYLAWNLTSAAGTAGPDTIRPLFPAETPLPTHATLPPQDRSRVSYSIALTEVAGLGSGTRAGTVVDLWVAWDPPLTDAPKLHRLLRNAFLEQIAPPVTPEGPTVAVFSIPRRDVDELLWADRYGSLSAVAVPSVP